MLSLTASAADTPSFILDPQQNLERTCFQTHARWMPEIDLRADVAIAYGGDRTIAERVRSWHSHGYIVHFMTGSAWGGYHDYMDGHLDEVQTDAAGHLHHHDGGIYYMCPTTNYGNYLCKIVRRALDAGVDAVDLEEPEFWVQDGWSKGFQEEWRRFYGQPWQAPDSSPDAQWRASNLKYFLYRRLLGQVFDSVAQFNLQTGRHVRCYVPTHSLLNYSTWRIVSPESSLARLDNCDGYIAQVWTGTARTPNIYRGIKRERTFDTAFLEYGAMQNLVRATGRTVWYLNDPIEDNPHHDWSDYRGNWECTLTASLFQPEVWRYEVAPWPDRVFMRKYPRGAPDAQPIPASYAAEFQIVSHALEDMNQTNIAWDGGPPDIGVLVSDSLMFERAGPGASDPDLGQIYGLALPFLKRGLPIQPVQLENASLPGYLDQYKCLLLTYRGMKPLNRQADSALASWVWRGGILIVCDDDGDPFNSVHEWWNTNRMTYKTPRQHLFEQLHLTRDDPHPLRVGEGQVTWVHRDPAEIAANPDGGAELVTAVKNAANRVASVPHPHFQWREANYLALRRGPYLIAAGLDESIAAPPRVLQGRFVNLFDSELRLQKQIILNPATRFFLLDIDAAPPHPNGLLAASCKAMPGPASADAISIMVEGIAKTPGIVLLKSPRPPRQVTLAEKPLDSFRYDAAEGLLWVKFPNEATARQLSITF